MALFKESNELQHPRPSAALRPRPADLPHYELPPELHFYTNHHHYSMNGVETSRLERYRSTWLDHNIHIPISSSPVPTPSERSFISTTDEDFDVPEVVTLATTTDNIPKLEVALNMQHIARSDSPRTEGHLKTTQQTQCDELDIDDLFEGDIDDEVLFSETDSLEIDRHRRYGSNIDLTARNGQAESSSRRQTFEIAGNGNHQKASSVLKLPLRKDEACSVATRSKLPVIDHRTSRLALIHLLSKDVNLDPVMIDSALAHDPNYATLILTRMEELGLDKMPFKVRGSQDLQLNDQASPHRSLAVYETARKESTRANCRPKDIKPDDSSQRKRLDGLVHDERNINYNEVSGTMNVDNALSRSPHYRASDQRSEGERANVPQAWRQSLQSHYTKDSKQPMTPPIRIPRQLSSSPLPPPPQVTPLEPIRRSDTPRPNDSSKLQPSIERELLARWNERESTPAYQDRSSTPSPVPGLDVVMPDCEMVEVHDFADDSTAFEAPSTQRDHDGFIKQEHMSSHMHNPVNHFLSPTPSMRVQVSTSPSPLKLNHVSSENGQGYERQTSSSGAYIPPPPPIPEQDSPLKLTKRSDRRKSGAHGTTKVKSDKSRSVTSGNAAVNKQQGNRVRSRKMTHAKQRAITGVLDTEPNGDPKSRRSTRLKAKDGRV